ncbi:MAG: GAF domain-containing sensor histidine kinase [Actinobacteria bacterium]|nr:GAF domain-containing sensor histidine kinase [Actinomycetota bacterium]
MDNQAFIIALASMWIAAGLVLVVRRPGLFGALVVATGGVAFATLADPARPYALGILPALGLHVVAALPDGSLPTRPRRWTVIFGYVFGAALATYLGASKPEATGPVVGAASVAAIAAAFTSTARYRRARGITRQRMQWFGWAVTVSAGIAVIAVALRLLVGWPTNVGATAAVAAMPVPLALAVLGTRKLISRIDRLLAHTVALAGLTGVVVAAYVVIVIGLGRTPTTSERTIIGLSMAAAAVSALLYLPARDRLTNLANRIVYGERQAPDDVLRTFGSRLSRAIPLDESLLQMVESMRKTFGVDVAEVWTGKDGILERFVSDPERGPGMVVVGEKERPVVSRAGVSGNAWIKVWLPQILAGRDGSQLRVAPITHSGELLGMIVAERRGEGEQFTEEQERVMTEVARQVGLALHNVQLDTQLQRTLDELRKQAEYLRASRLRIVASEDAARRKIERDIHDGAQQRLVALRVKLRLAQQLIEKDPSKLKDFLDGLSTEAQETVEELRELSHGIYPALLTSEGLVPALESVAQKALLPTIVERGENVGRYPQDVETAVYFICREALQNAGKHAGEGAKAHIRVWQDEGSLNFEVADDGAGFDREGRGLGSGFVNMEDRLGAVGGTLEVESAPAQGTTIKGRIPVA